MRRFILLTVLMLLTTTVSLYAQDTQTYEGETFAVDLPAEFIRIPEDEGDNDIKYANELYVRDDFIFQSGAILIEISEGFQGDEITLVDFEVSQENAYFIVGYIAGVHLVAESLAAAFSGQTDDELEVTIEQPEMVNVGDNDIIVYKSSQYNDYKIFVGIVEDSFFMISATTAKGEMDQWQSTIEDIVASVQGI